MHFKEVAQAESYLKAIAHCLPEPPEARRVLCSCPVLHGCWSSPRSLCHQFLCHSLDTSSHSQVKEATGKATMCHAEQGCDKASLQKHRHIIFFPAVMPGSTSQFSWDLKCNSLCIHYLYPKGKLWSIFHICCTCFLETQASRNLGHLLGINGNNTGNSVLQGNITSFGWHLI